eukprot:3118820-Pyramimonas_sp.AAC.1
MGAPGWKATAAFSAGGLALSDPLSPPRKEPKTWSNLRGASDEKPERMFKELCQPLPMIQPEAIRATSAACRARAAQAVGGSHMRRYSWLSDPALRVVSLLSAISESLSSLPRQLQIIQVALLRKASGGWRPIGLSVSTR